MKTLATRLTLMHNDEEKEMRRNEIKMLADCYGCFVCCKYTG